MPKPIEIFDEPATHWSLLTSPTDDQFEHQHLDRKETGRDPTGGISKSQLDRLRDEITECISAFANSNREGGLLVIGISSTGEVKGISRLTDEQRNSITNINNLLANQSAKSKFVDCTDGAGNPNRICLIHAPYTERAFCQTLGSPPKAWTRHGTQNLPLNDQQREQIKHEKRIVDFESQYCCPFDAADLDAGVVSEFRKAVASGSDLPDEQFLYQAGALQKSGKDYAFTKAGLLFFAANPQRILEWAKVRVLRYEASLEQEAELGLVSLDRPFTGSLSQQIPTDQVLHTELRFFQDVSDQAKRGRISGRTRDSADSGG